MASNPCLNLHSYPTACTAPPVQYPVSLASKHKNTNTSLDQSTYSVKHGSNVWDWPTVRKMEGCIVGKYKRGTAAFTRAYRLANYDKVRSKEEASKQRDADQYGPTRKDFNREKSRLQARVSRAKDPAKHAEASARYIERHRDRLNDKQRIDKANFFQNNPETVREKGRRHYREKAGILNATGEQRFGTFQVCINPDMKLYFDHCH